MTKRQSSYRALSVSAMAGLSKALNLLRDVEASWVRGLGQLRPPDRAVCVLIRTRSRRLPGQVHVTQAAAPNFAATLKLSEEL